MSLETRQKLVDDKRIVLTSTQRADLLDPAKTNTWLVEFLIRLLETAGHPILVTALNSDHRPGTHHEGGRAVDLWNADWETVGDAKIVDVMQAAGAIGRSGKPTLVEVGLYGSAAAYKSYVTWPSSAYVYVKPSETDNEHVHCAVGVPS